MFLYLPCGARWYRSRISDLSLNEQCYSELQTYPFLCDQLFWFSSFGGFCFVIPSQKLRFNTFRLLKMHAWYTSLPTSPTSMLICQVIKLNLFVGCVVDGRHANISSWTIAYGTEAQGGHWPVLFLFYTFWISFFTFLFLFFVFVFLLYFSNFFSLFRFCFSFILFEFYLSLFCF